jgi:metallo-beta-lactamase class B
MKRYLLLATAFAVIMASSPAAQGGRQGGGITRGANQPRQNPWSAKAPWGQTERSAPMELQKKEPFKVFDNVYYTGLQTVASYLVTTSAGLVLIDSGYPQTADLLLESIRKTGNDPKNVRYVLATHSHADHYGGAARVKQESGARIGMSAEDWTSVEAQQSTPPTGGGPAPTPIQRDLILKDGESLQVGDETFKFHFTPGQTAGATSIEFQARDGARSHRTIVPGGLGVQYQANWGPAFKSSILKLKKLGPWDVALGNHPFLAPKDLEIVEMEIKTRGSGPHPAVVGPQRVDAFFDAILRVVDEKLIAEPPTGPPTQ